jgi:hypothetical protein
MFKSYKIKNIFFLVYLFFSNSFSMEKSNENNKNNNNLINDFKNFYKENMPEKLSDYYEEENIDKKWIEYNFQIISEYANNKTKFPLLDQKIKESNHPVVCIFDSPERIKNILIIFIYQNFVSHKFGFNNMEEMKLYIKKENNK